MILVDSNVPMYLVGAAHPHKADSRRLIEAALAAGEKLVTDAEVLQEILHRYVSIDRRDAIQPAFDVLLEVTDDVFPVEHEDAERAKRLVLERPRVSARDAVHAAIMYRRKIRRILTFDRGFDEFPDIQRLA